MVNLSDYFKKEYQQESPVKSSPTVSTPAVITSKTAKDLTTKNQNYLGSAESGITSNTLNQPLNISSSSTNPSQNAIVGNINDTMSKLNDEQRSTALSGAIGELLKRINSSGDVELSLTSKARNAESEGDYYSLNQSVKELKELQKQRVEDLQKLQQEISPLRQQVLSTYTPTEKETELKTELSDLQQEMKQYNIDTQKMVYGLEGQGRGIVSGLVSGQQAKLQRQRALDYQSMSAREANLLTSVGLEEEARKANREALTTGISMLESDYELQSKISDKIEEQNKSIIEQAQKLSESSKDMLTFILKQFEGIDYESLPENSKSAIDSLAKEAGIDIGIIQAGLKAVKDQQDFENSISKSKLKTTQKEEEKETSLESSKSNVKSDIQNITGSDGYADTKKIQQIRQSIALNEPDILSWFDKAYPPALVLNPNDPETRDLIEKNKWY